MNKRDLRHYICLAAIVGSVLCSVFVFPSAFIRFVEACRDFGLSIAYFFCELAEIDHKIDPPVQYFSVVEFEPIFEFPFTWEEFTALAGKWWHKLFDPDNFRFYCVWFGHKSLNVARFLSIALPLLLIAYLFFDYMISKTNNNLGKESISLRWYKNYPERFFGAVKRVVLDFVEFVKCHKIYFYIFAFVWAWNFHLIAVFIEFFAFYFFFIVNFDFVGIYRQVLKLFLDLSVMVRFIPVIAWIVIGIIVFDKIRKKIGYDVLLRHEAVDTSFVEDLPVGQLDAATMGAGKTLHVVDMTLTTEVMFRNEAFKRLYKNDLKFPCFPWGMFEQALKEEMKRHRVYNLVTCRFYVRKIRRLFETSLKRPEYTHSFLKRIKRKNGYWLQSLCFGYDWEKYGLTYNDALVVIELFDVLETYAQLYFIYVVESSYILSNFSVRSDNIKSDIGNFPLWDLDFFHRDPVGQKEYSRLSHILDFDCLRLGKRMLENNRNADFFEFGIVVISEFGKERKNFMETKEIKKNVDEVNQKNDGFVSNIKMIRHAATVDNYCFVKIFTDEQRVESLEKDNRALFKLLHLTSKSSDKLAMPFFTIEGTVCEWYLNFFNGLYYKFRHNRADNNLVMYLLKKIAAHVEHYKSRIDNTFGYYEVKILLENGSEIGDPVERLYYESKKKDFSGRYSSDCFADFYAERAYRSPVGLADLPCYASIRASAKELLEQHSYFVEDLFAGLKMELANE